MNSATILDPDVVLTTLDGDIDSGLDIWETATSAAFVARASMDNFRWLIGDIADRVNRKYGEQSLQKFASAIKIENKKTLYSYWRVSKFYATAPRGDFQNLSWSHFREAMRVDDPDEALEWLERASANDWPVAELASQIKAALGEDKDDKPDDVLLDVGGVKVRLFNPASGELTLIVADISSAQAFTDFWKRDKPLMRLVLTQEAL